MGAVATKLTVDQFLALPETPEVKRELLDGEVIEMGWGGPVHETVKARIQMRLSHNVISTGLSASICSETMYHLAAESSLEPDVSVVLSGSLDPDRTGRITIAPDIAIEVVSSESAERLEKKVQVYLSCGVRAVWVLYPVSRTITVYRRESVTQLRSGGTLQDAELLPGFSVAVDKLFAGA